MINLKILAKFLVKAKINTYASNGSEITPQRPGFNELEFIERDLEYRDSYCGFFSAPGQEIVRYKGKPVWNMAYNGGMSKEYISNIEFSGKVYKFLKEALKKVEESKPFRGPNNLKQGNFEYINVSSGNIASFKGTEKIFYQGKEVFRQDYIGGLIIDK